MTAGNFLNRSFGLTTAFLFAMAQICGMGAAAVVYFEV